MLTRILTSLIGLVVFFVLLFVNPIFFNAAVFLFLLGMLHEMYTAIKANIAVRIIGFISAAALVYGMLTNQVMPYLLCSVMVYMASSVVLHGRIDFKQIYASAFITWFLTLFMSCIMLLHSQHGSYATIVIFICAWMTDTSAYFAGIFLGKHKLIPYVSPKKTVEGAIGGIAGATIGCCIYAFILTKTGHITAVWQNYIMFAVLGMLASMLAQIGDLVASAIKRDCNVKDFGNLFPGHGGILDRFDSVVFITPFVYYYITMVMFR